MTSGALVQLVSRGVQDAFTASTMDKSLFRQRYTRCSNFSQSPSELTIVGKIASGSRSIIEIPKNGDLINYMWIEVDEAYTTLRGTTFEFWVGSQMIDSQTIDWVADIWQVYLAETSSKSSVFNTKFFPFHFSWCDNSQFFPLISVPNSQVEVRVKWGSNITEDIKVYGNFVYLDTAEREYLASGKARDMMITQVQRLEFNNKDGDMNLDISALNHPVKCLFWGHETQTDELNEDYFTFSSARILHNGQDLTPDMSSTYYHTTQSYHHTSHALTSFVNNGINCPFYTRYYMYSYADDSSSMNSTGSCNFSRLDNANIRLKGVDRPPERSNSTICVYALSWNVLRFKSGLCGILFSN